MENRFIIVIVVALFIVALLQLMKVYDIASMFKGNKFEEKLNFVINMDIKPNNKYELTNLISKNRAEWLLAKTDEYFIE